MSKVTKESYQRMISVAFYYNVSPSHGFQTYMYSIYSMGGGGVGSLRKVVRHNTVKKVSDIPVPSRDVTYQTLNGQE